VLRKKNANFLGCEFVLGDVKIIFPPVFFLFEVEESYKSANKLFGKLSGHFHCLRQVLE